MPMKIPPSLVQAWPAILTALVVAGIGLTTPRIIKRKDVRPNLVETVTQLASYRKTKMLKENQAILYAQFVRIMNDSIKTVTQTDKRTELLGQLKAFTDTRNEAVTKAIEYSDKVAAMQGKARILLVDLNRGFPWLDISISMDSLIKFHANARYFTDHPETLNIEQCLFVEDTLFMGMEKIASSDQIKLNRLTDQINADLAYLPYEIIFVLVLIAFICLIVFLLVLAIRPASKDTPQVIDKYIVVEVANKELLMELLKKAGVKVV